MWCEPCRTLFIFYGERIGYQLRIALIVTYVHAHSHHQSCPSPIHRYNASPLAPFVHLYNDKALRRERCSSQFVVPAP